MAHCVEDGEHTNPTAQFERQAGFSLGGGWPKGLDYPEKGVEVPSGAAPERPSRTALDDYKLAGNSQILGEYFPPVDHWEPETAAASAEEKLWLPYKEK